VLDLRMPGLDGIQALEKMKSLAPKPDLIVLSGVDARLRAAAARIADRSGWKVRYVLSKPVAVEEIVRILSRIEPDCEVLADQDIRACLEEQRVAVVYQPKVSLTTEAEWVIEGVEALARLHHPVRGEVVPEKFLDSVQRAGLTGDLTGIVLRTVLRDMAELHSQGYVLDVAVNVSPSLLADPELPDRFETLIRDHGISPSQLVLEITEGAPWPEDCSVMESLTRLRLKGIRLSLDDFGTGHSSLVQLYRMPFSELKIDRSFISELDWNDDAKIITRSMIDLAHALGLEVCAEGLEARSQLEFLKSVGCDRAQGFLVAKPVAFAQLRELLRRQLYVLACSVATNRVRSALATACA
jgi:EAL domain-containing protein (putative c-di-GMP-specific phosphodiesterase class I)